MVDKLSELIESISVLKAKADTLYVTEWGLVISIPSHEGQQEQKDKREIARKEPELEIAAIAAMEQERLLLQTDIENLAQRMEERRVGPDVARQELQDLKHRQSEIEKKALDITGERNKRFVGSK